MKLLKTLPLVAFLAIGFSSSEVLAKEEKRGKSNHYSSQQGKSQLGPSSIRQQHSTHRHYRDRNRHSYADRYRERHNHHNRHNYRDRHRHDRRYRHRDYRDRYHHSHRYYPRHYGHDHVHTRYCPSRHFRSDFAAGVIVGAILGDW